MAGSDKRTRTRLTVTVEPSALAEAEALAAWRFGGNMSALTDAAFALAVAVFNNPAAHGKADPLEALAAVCAARA